MILRMDTIHQGSMYNTNQCIRMKYGAIRHMDERMVSIVIATINRESFISRIFQLNESSDPFHSKFTVCALNFLQLFFCILFHFLFFSFLSFVCTVYMFNLAKSECECLCIAETKVGYTFYTNYVQEWHMHNVQKHSKRMKRVREIKKGFGSSQK